MSTVEVKLAELCEVITKGTTPSNIGAEFTDEGIKYIRSEMLTSSKHITEDGFLYISEDTHCKLKRSQLKAGDILFSMAGAYLGKTAILRECDVPANTNQAVALIRIIPEKCNHEYVYYYLNLPKVVKSVNSITGQAAQPNINLRQIGDIPIVLPPKETQDKIVSMVSAYDSLIEINHKQIKLLEEAAQRQYKEWFVDLRFPGHETTRIIDGIPEGWLEASIADVCTKINAGGTPSRSNLSYWNPASIKWFKTGELLDCWLIDSSEKISEEGLSHSSAKLFPQNTILMAIYASPTLGRLGILTTEAACNQAALCLVANENTTSWQWLYQKLYELRDEFNAVAKGAGQQNISADVVKKKTIIIPSKQYIDQYTNIAEPMFDAMRTLQTQNVQLQETRDRLLPKLMSGEIEV